jgi:RNA polymerase sigma-70 factor (ECF subfamily)
MENPGEITLLLHRLSAGEAGAEEQLFPLIYNQLRKLAGSFLRRERPGHTLQATALVHEAYLRMAGQYKLDWKGRAHFFGVAASVMRRILIDDARMHQAEKRGSGKGHLLLDEALVTSDENLDLLLSLDEALEHLAKQDPRQAKIVEMRFFSGLTEEEIGLILGLSERTVKRDWVVAKSWLQAELGGVKCREGT